MKEDLEEKITLLGFVGGLLGIAGTTAVSFGIEPIKDYFSNLDVMSFGSLYVGASLAISIPLAFLGDYIHKKYVKKK